MTKTTLVKVLVAMIAALYLGGCGCSVEEGSYAGGSPTVDEGASTSALSVELTSFDYAEQTKTASTAVRTEGSLAFVRLTLSLTRADGTTIGSPVSWAGTPAEAAAGIEMPVASGLADGEMISVRASVTAPDGRHGSVVRAVAVRTE